MLKCDLHPCLREPQSDGGDSFCLQADWVYSGPVLGVPVLRRVTGLVP